MYLKNNKTLAPFTHLGQSFVNSFFFTISSGQTFDRPKSRYSISENMPGTEVRTNS